MTHVCEEMKGSMYTVYEDNSDEMQMKLQELSKVLDNCTRLHQELLEATQALSGLRASLGIKKQEWPSRRYLAPEHARFFACVLSSSFRKEPFPFEVNRAFSVKIESLLRLM